LLYAAGPFRHVQQYEFSLERGHAAAGWSFFWRLRGRRRVAGSDVAIAIAYFSVPVAMLWVLRNRREELLYPGIGLSFVLFITACGGTHALHAPTLLKLV